MFEGCPLIEKLFLCDNELDRFDVLAMAALNAPKYPEEKKTDEYRVRSCQTKTWFFIGDDGNDYYVESDSLFIKGLCVALIEAAKKTSADAKKIGFADELYARGIISIDRRNGLVGIEEKIIKHINNPKESNNEKSH